MEQRVEGTLRVWAEPFVPLRVPKLFNLRTDPHERADKLLAGRIVAAVEQQRCRRGVGRDHPEIGRHDDGRVLQDTENARTGETSGTLISSGRPETVPMRPP